jgi:hypothetical protein
MTKEQNTNNEIYNSPTDDSWDKAAEDYWNLISTTSTVINTTSTLSNTNHTAPIWVYPPQTPTYVPMSIGTSATSAYVHQTQSKINLNNCFLLRKIGAGKWKCFQAIHYTGYDVHFLDDGKISVSGLNKKNIVVNQETINKAKEKGIEIIDSWPEELLTENEENMKDIIE